MRSSASKSEGGHVARGAASAADIRGGEILSLAAATHINAARITCLWQVQGSEQGVDVPSSGCGWTWNTWTGVAGPA